MAAQCGVGDDHLSRLGALYGARANEDPGRSGASVPECCPPSNSHGYDRERHERTNYVDRNTIVFRLSLRHIRYDESLDAAFDWDHSLRLFAEAEPLALPALSCYYRTVVADRVSDVAGQGESVRRVRSRSDASRPLRVLVHSAMYPVISETYIGEDIDALEREGRSLQFRRRRSRLRRGRRGAAAPRRSRVDRRFKPVLALMHWATHAVGEFAHGAVRPSVRLPGALSSTWTGNA